MFHCTHCDGQHHKWAGRCSECGSWGTITEGDSPTTPIPSSGRRGAASAKATIVSGDGTVAKVSHQPTGIAELDRVLGGGLVAGAVVLLSGEPGIGKSTLVSQIVGSYSPPTTPNPSSERRGILISSGEESPSQIQLRLDRLAVPRSKVNMIEETCVESVATAVGKISPALVVVDSIQTASTLEVEGLPGSPSQVRASAVKLVELAKRSSTPVMIVGQITKDGSIAGPKMLEHLVDVVLSLEGDATHAYRLLRATKNRFGTTDEVGIFEMTEGGLKAVEDPSKQFLSERVAGPGSVVTCVMEGNRALLVEVQALVDKTSFGYPVRRSVGFDLNRLQLLIAIANRFCGAALDQSDVYVNVVGGIELTEPAADLAVLTAILSAKKGTAFSDAMIVGEVGLGGEIRSVSFAERRRKEAERFGLKAMQAIKHVKELG